MNDLHVKLSETQLHAQSGHVRKQGGTKKRKNPQAGRLGRI